MKKLVAVIDMQNDFICGALSNSDTEKILPAVAEYVKRADEQGAEIVFTRDTHDENYAQTQEGRKLPVPHCVKNTKGWQIAEALSDYVQNVFDKYTFGSLLLAQYALDNQFDCIDRSGNKRRGKLLRGSHSRAAQKRHRSHARLPNQHNLKK